MNKITRLIISILACFLAAYIGSVFTTPSISTWYASLNKPFFNPPNWIFGPVWTLLYLMMALALYIIWDNGMEKAENKQALGIFAVQLALNSLWSIAFFGWHSPLAGLVIIVLLWSAIFMTIQRFNKISRTAGWLLVPYIAWVSFAAILNFMIFWLNR